LFLSRRLDESWFKWSEPIPLDSSINTLWDENSISLSVLGDTAYFVSSDDSTEREGIYFALLPLNYQPLPYIVIQGTVASSKNGKTEPLAHPVEFIINNFDGDFFFRDTIFDGNFRFAIPYNTQYNFFVQSPGFESFSFSTSAWGIKETFLRLYNVYLKPEVTSESKEKNKPTETLIGTIYFATDIDTLDADAYRLLMDLKDFLINNPDLKIHIVGHTDEVGTESYNINLSLRRARNTADFLSETLGISRKRIQIEGKGKTQPISQDLSKNRRVEIFVIENE
jgi:outer membrane protein OmpA-like peptidoglycan-associated protein